MSFGVKNSDMKEGQAAFMHLFISSINFCKFLQWIVSPPDLLKRSSNDAS